MLQLLGFIEIFLCACAAMIFVLLGLIADIYGYVGKLEARIKELENSTKG
jgi:hypothetical protein